MRLVWQLVAVAAVAFLGGQGLAAAEDKPWLQLAVGVPTAVLAVLVYGWVVRRTERRPSTEVALEGAPAATVRGTLIGATLFGAVMVNLFTSGYYEVDGLGSVTGAVGLFGFMAAAAVTEELMFRGVLFRITEERIGTWIALVLTGALFGLSHLLNPDAGLWGATAIAIEAGGMLTAAYVATRKLWVPIGLHFGWNFAASGIFSTEVSGNDTPRDCWTPRRRARRCSPAATSARRKCVLGAVLRTDDDRVHVAGLPAWPCGASPPARRADRRHR